jgi:hypothetical protein
MNCRQTRRLLPLFAGGDLTGRKARRGRKHLEACADCRRELEAYRTALRVVADAVREAPAGDWTPGEWRAVMDRVAKEKPEPREQSAAAPAKAPKWVPAVASGAAIVLMVAVGLLLKDSPVKPAGIQARTVLGERTPRPRESGEGLLGLAAPDMASQPSGSKTGGPTAAAPNSSKQDVLTMTLVSPDTGLQVVWVFNKDFDWKGDSN